MAEGGVWRTISGRRVFIKDGQSLTGAMKSSGKFKDVKKSKGSKDVKAKVAEQFKKKADKETLIERKAIAEQLRGLGADVDKGGNVTIYHITTPDNYESIMDSGEIWGNQSPIGGGSTLGKIGDRSFHTWDKGWVEKWRQSDDSKVIEMKLPAEYVRQGAQNKKEIYVEGTLKKREGNIWAPDKKPTSTFYDRRAVRRYEAKKK